MRSTSAKRAGSKLPRDTRITSVPGIGVITCRLRSFSNQAAASHRNPELLATARVLCLGAHLEHAERLPVNQQPVLHLAESRSRPVILLLRECSGKVLPEPVEMLADDPADLLVARGPMPGVRWLSAGRARHARQRRAPEGLFLISKQPVPGSQIVK